jgi:hypothetical protein
MAAPIANKVILPDDSGNTGKKVRTQTRVVGSDTVHEHFFISVSKAAILGVYRAGLATVAAATSAQNGTSTGALWFHVPSAISGKSARIRKIVIASRHTTAFAALIGGRLVADRFTFTGTASGASVTATKNDSSAPTPVADLRTAVTGLTPTLVGSHFGILDLVGAVTAVATYAPLPCDMLNGDAPGLEDEWPIIAPGEGLVIYQDVAATGSSTHTWDGYIVWDEIDTS